MDGVLGGDRKALDHFANTLKFESKAPTNGLEGLDLESIYNDHYYPGPNGLDHALLGTSRTERRPPVIATPHIPPVPTNAPPIVTTTPTTTTTATPEGGASKCRSWHSARFNASLCHHSCHH